MFNVIKGSIINKNVKPVVISNERNNNTKIDNLEKEFNALEENPKKSEELFFEHEEEQEISYYEEQRTLDMEIDEKKEEIKALKKELEVLTKEAEFKAQSIINSALEEANNEVNDIKAMAWEEGFNRGKSEAKESMAEDIDSILISANRVLTEASMKAREIFLQNKQEILKLSFDIAKKIIKKEISHREVLFNNLLEAMKKVQASKSIKIFVNWEQLVYSEEIKEKLKSSFQGIEIIEIIEDRTVEAGGCVIETKLGKIDATIDSQLDMVINALFEE